MEEQIEILQLENAGLRVQNDLQQKAIDSMERELKVLRRFKQIVSRAGNVADSLVVR